MAPDTAASVDFDLKVSISLTSGLADRFRIYCYTELCEIEADDPEVLALEHDLPGLWARMLDRQRNPFAEIYDVSGEDMWDDYRWFGDVIRT